jgi:hypothetical protein
LTQTPEKNHCEQKKCHAPAEYLIGTARVPVCTFHAEEWLTKCFKKPDKQKEMREKWMQPIFDAKDAEETSIVTEDCGTPECPIRHHPVGRK